MRRLLCKPCGQHLRPGERQTYAASLDGPAEFERVVFGVAREPLKEQRRIDVVDLDDVGTAGAGVRHDLDPSYYNCDGCNRPIRPGDEAYAWTAWVAHRGLQIEPWELEFIIPRVEPDVGNKERS